MEGSSKADRATLFQTPLCGPKTSVAFFSIATIYMQQQKQQHEQQRIYLIANFQVTAARQMTVYRVAVRALSRCFHFPFLLP